MNKFLVILCLLSITGLAQDKVLIEGSEGQWPMSGGPNGHWQVKSTLDAASTWSVRTGEGIKWKTDLPEGGQSGICIWKDKLFLTINKPLNLDARVTFADLHKQLIAKKKSFKIKEKEIAAKLADNKNIASVIAKYTKAEAAYSALKAKLEAKGIVGNGLVKQLRKSSEGKALTQIDKEYFKVMYKESAEFKAAHVELTKLQRSATSKTSGADIVLYCLDAETGKILWNKPLKGKMASGYNYGFSDSTTPTPACDGKNVWAINSSGAMACYDMDGKLIWERTWMPTGKRPFNKQYDTILVGDLLLNVEPPEKGDSTRKADWNYLRGIDKLTGKTLWVCKEAITHYNTPVAGYDSTGKPAVLIARGGPHGVPERPVGLSLVSLVKSDNGKVLWNWSAAGKDDGGWGALNVQHWNSKTSSWFYGKGDCKNYQIDNETKKIVTHYLNKGDYRSFDVKSNKYVLAKDKSFGHECQRHCNIIVGKYLMYLVRYKPFVARHNLETGKTEFLEIPTEVNKVKGQKDTYIWKTKFKNDGLNSRGQRHYCDDRTLGDGAQKCFLGSPIAVNGKVYFTNALGITYVIDSKVEVLDASALLGVNDIGLRGETMSYNTMGFANGKLFHRSVKSVICIETKK